MPETCDISLQNKLTAEKRDINVYHHSTRSSHIISFNNAFTFPFKTAGACDYLHISAVSGPGVLKNDCWIDMPSWTDFEFSSAGKVIVSHTGTRTLLKIPAGPPTWQLKIKKQAGPFNGTYVTISDDKDIG
ncbi:MAG: hypothetical protein GY950_10020 [bacterium]|nr:hypothetical protein [bacterium]